MGEQPKRTGCTSTTIRKVRDQLQDGQSRTIRALSIEIGKSSESVKIAVELLSDYGVIKSNQVGRMTIVSNGDTNAQT